MCMKKEDEFEVDCKTFRQNCLREFLIKMLVE